MIVPRTGPKIRPPSRGQRQGRNEGELGQRVAADEHDGGPYTVGIDAGLQAAQGVRAENLGEPQIPGEEHADGDQHQQQGDPRPSSPLATTRRLAWGDRSYRVQANHVRKRRLTVGVSRVRL